MNNEEIIINNFNEKIYEMICTFKRIEGKKVGIKLKKGDTEETLFYYDIQQSKLIFDRGNSGENFATKYGTKRMCNYDGNYLKIHAFVDISSVEIFINDGEEVFTSRIFNSSTSTNINLFAQGYADVDLKLYTLLS